MSETPTQKNFKRQMKEIKYNQSTDLSVYENELYNTKRTVRFDPVSRSNGNTLLAILITIGLSIIGYLIKNKF